MVNNRANFINGVLLDSSYETIDDKSVIVLFVKANGKIEKFYDFSFSPYLYVLLKSQDVDDIDDAFDYLKNFEFEDNVFCSNIEIVEKYFPEERKVLKIYFKNTSDLIKARKILIGENIVEDVREFDIPFALRYLTDKKLSPTSLIELEFEITQIKVSNDKNKNSVSEKDIKKIVNISNKDGLVIDLDLNCGAFDLETLSPERFSKAEKDPIVMISFVGEIRGKRIKKIFTWKGKKNDFVVVCDSEKDMLENFLAFVNDCNLDVLITYNGDNFDLPYITERCKLYGLSAGFGVDGKEMRSIRKGIDFACALKGVQHVDAFRIIRLLARFSAIDLIKFDLENVSEKLFGEKKEKLYSTDINEIWENGNKKDFDRLIDYNLKDSEVTLKIFLEYGSLFLELSRLARLSLFDVSRATSSQIIERLLINESFDRNILVNNKPNERMVKAREMHPIKGGFVKKPEKGLHENIAVLDFRSLHPSIIISHNISPETFLIHPKNQKNVSPDGYAFAVEPEGLFPKILKQLFNDRVNIKKEMKLLKSKEDKNSKNLFRILDSKQQALKIVLNSAYGYLGFSRARWYSRECASSVTAWSRYYVQNTISLAEKEGFIPIYGDTDSNFLVVPKGKTKQDVLIFLKKVNDSLPGNMELEFENYFKRGIFVTKKEGGEAAKKKYALVDFEGNLKIVGFEYVRRDWANIAKSTQKEVIEEILVHGNPVKAVELVRKVISDLKAGKIKKEDLVIQTILKRDLNNYNAIGPHVAAAQKAVSRGKFLEIGSVLGFIITKSGKSISDKAELEEYVNEGNYDADYYIKNQVLPAVIKILRELGYSEDDLIQGGKQSNLNSFFG